MSSAGHLPEKCAKNPEKRLKLAKFGVFGRYCGAQSRLFMTNKLESAPQNLDCGLENLVGGVPQFSTL
jgi:hypothetical protein